MVEDETRDWFVKELDDSENIDPERWCEKCQYSYAFLMDGIGICSKQEDKLCYYCSTCKYFESKKESKLESM